MSTGTVIAGEDQKSSRAVTLQREIMGLHELPRHQLQAPHGKLLAVVAAVLLALGEPLAGGDAGEHLEQLGVAHSDEVDGDGRVVVGALGHVQGQRIELDARAEDGATGQQQHEGE
ncbi:hypothetical protein D9M73_249960 [compost metagenome]